MVPVTEEEYIVRAAHVELYFDSIKREYERVSEFWMQMLITMWRKPLPSHMAYSYYAWNLRKLQEQLNLPPSQRFVPEHYNDKFLRNRIRHTRMRLVEATATKLRTGK